ncbi:MAG: PqqD family protein [Nitrospirota bacterium]
MDINGCLARRYVKDSSVVFRKIAEEFILVPIKQKADEVDSIYTINEVAGRIWELIDGEKTLSEIKNVIIDEFEVSPEIAEIDLIEFIKQLEHIGAIKEV